MKAKHDVKYLITAMTLSLVASATLSATEVTKTDNETNSVPVIETIQPIDLAENTDNVDIPVLAKPKLAKPELAAPIVVANTDDVNDKAETAELEQLTETDSTVPSTLTEPMPIAENKTNSYIPLIEGAIVFSNFDGELPAIVNYYTTALEQEIIDFYQQSFGDVTSQERKRGRLTLTYQADDLEKRVVISVQNEKHQVDVIVKQVTE